MVATESQAYVVLLKFKNYAVHCYKYRAALYDASKIRALYFIFPKPCSKEFLWIC